MERTTSMWAIVRELHRLAQIQRRAAAVAPLGPVATGILNVAAQAPVRPKVAAAELDVPAQSVTRAIAGLVEAGLVRRVEDTADGRSYTVELTDEGVRARARFRDELTDGFATHLTDWSDDEVADFAGKLRHLADALAADAPAHERGGRNPWRSG